MRLRPILAPALGLLLALGASGRARAGIVTGTVYENTTAAGKATLDASTNDSTGSATFTVNPVYGVDYAATSTTGKTIADFLHLTASSFNNTTGTFNSADLVSPSKVAGTGTYIVLTGTIHLTAGTNTYSVSHDDGASLAISAQNGGITVGGFSNPGPTQDVNDHGSFAVPTTADYTFKLAYGEVNGLPAILNFKVDGQVVGVPEPASMAMCGTAIAAVSGLSWRRGRKARAAKA